MPTRVTTVFFDGHCGLCHGFVRFLLARDPRGELFDFAPLQGDYFAAVIPESRRRGIPDSVVISPDGGPILVKAAAVLHVLKQLGGGYRLLAAISGLLPRRLLDGVYDGIAKIRGKLFAKPPGICPLIPSDLRARFHL